MSIVGLAKCSVLKQTFGNLIFPAMHWTLLRGVRVRSTKMQATDGTLKPLPVICALRPQEQLLEKKQVFWGTP